MIHGAISCDQSTFFDSSSCSRKFPAVWNELLRDDRRAQRHVGERVLAHRSHARPAPLEVLAHRVDVELGDDVAFDAPDLAVVERDELHARCLQPRDDLGRVLVRREHRIEDLRDRARLDDERHPLVERQSLDVERRQPQRRAELRSGSAMTGYGIWFRSANST